MRNCCAPHAGGQTPGGTGERVLPHRLQLAGEGGAAASRDQAQAAVGRATGELAAWPKSRPGMLAKATVALRRARAKATQLRDLGGHDPATRQIVAQTRQLGFARS